MQYAAGRRRRARARATAADGSGATGPYAIRRTPYEPGFLPPEENTTFELIIIYLLSELAGIKELRKHKI